MSHSSPHLHVPSSMELKELFLAVERYHVHHVAVFLSHCPQALEARDEAGKTPLHVAILQSDTRVINFLLEQKANVDTQDMRGRTPLMDTVMLGDFDRAHRLLNSGADPDICDHDNKTVFNILYRIMREAEKKQEDLSQYYDLEYWMHRAQDVKKAKERQREKEDTANFHTGVTQAVVARKLPLKTPRGSS